MPTSDGTPWRSSSPRRARDLDNQLELPYLLRDRKLVAVHGAREAALRGESQLLEWGELRRLVDAAFDRRRVFERAEFGRDEPEDDELALGQEAQRTEITAA